ncbi:MAG: DUF4388 domain-containing protein [Pyrinomonadaceae bacterium]
MCYDAAAGKDVSCRLPGKTENEKRMQHAPLKMHGQIAEQPIAEIMRALNARQLSGALRLQHEQVQPSIYFKAGDIIFAISNLRALRLDNFLRQLNIFPEQRLAEILKNSQSEVDFGLNLIKANLIDQAGLSQIFERRTRQITSSALLLPKGEWKFEASVKPTQNAHPGLDLSDLLLEVGRRLPLSLIKKSLLAHEEKLTLNKKAPFKPGLDLRPAEALVLSRTDAPVSVADIILLTGLAEAEALRSAYALLLGGLIEREKWPEVLESQSAAEIENEKLKKAEAQPTAPAAEQGDRHTPHTPAIDDDVSEQVRAQELFARAQGENHYEVLGVDRDADSQKIKLAYYDLARKYHPDRFRQRQQSAVRSRIEMSFARIREAYDALKKQTTRAVQSGFESSNDNANVSAQGAPREAVTTPTKRPSPLFTPTPVEQMAEDKFQQGLVELQKGNEVLAVARLSERCSSRRSRRVTTLSMAARSPATLRPGV